MLINLEKDVRVIVDLMLEILWWPGWWSIMRVLNVKLQLCWCCCHN